MHKVLQSCRREGGSWGSPYKGGNGWAVLKDEQESVREVRKGKQEAYVMPKEHHVKKHKGKNTQSLCAKL